MRNKRVGQWMALGITIVFTILSFVFQRYSLSQLEENYIFLFDKEYIGSVLDECGGPSLLISSFCTQFMKWLWIGPIWVGIICGLIVLSLTQTMAKLNPQPWIFSFVVFPIVFLWLCLENNSFKFQGLVSLCIALLFLWGYISLPRRLPLLWSKSIAVLLAIFLYWFVGSVSILFILGILILELPKGWKYAAFNILLLALFYGCAMLSYYTGLVPTTVRAFSPGMYYEWDTTWYMLLYSWIAVTVCFILSCIFRDSKNTELRGKNLVLFVLVCLAGIGLGVKFYILVHSSSVYRTMQQRYYCKQEDWDAILNIKYGNEKTPFTSYRLLAMAKKGILVDNLKSANPFIGYFMENKTLVKKEDLEVLSDIFYQCRSMGEVRRYAFDTNMVTPGAFNPVETLKLVEINIAYGDYEVAEKLIANLEKTMFYADKAHDLRRFLNRDDEVERDVILGPMRRAIPTKNSYMSPRGTGRDLLYAADANIDNIAAREFYRTFLILTSGHE